MKPNSGGVAILLGVAIPWVLIPSHSDSVGALCLLGLALAGFLDDRRELTPTTKLILQFAAAVALISQGVIWRVSGVSIVDASLTALWIVGITNAFNLIDNMDGVCAGVTTLVAGAETVIAVKDGIGPHAILLALIAGANIGFLVFNHSPARIFMGDCGSLFNGFAMAWLSIPTASVSPGRPLLANLSPLLLLSYPIFDTVLVAVSRWKAGRSIFIGGRDHSSHRLVSLGLSERKAARVIWVLALVPAALAVMTHGHALLTATMVAIIASGYATITALLTAQHLKSRHAPQNAPSNASASNELNVLSD
ncbi:MAG: MraY family glycosyltransferase [Acidobacteriota bacterium]